MPQTQTRLPAPADPESAPALSSLTAPGTPSPASVPRVLLTPRRGTTDSVYPRPSSSRPVSLPARQHQQSARNPFHAPVVRAFTHDRAEETAHRRLQRSFFDTDGVLEEGIALQSLRRIRSWTARVGTSRSSFLRRAPTIGASPDPTVSVWRAWAST